MNEKNYFYFDNLKHIYFIGAVNFFKQLININKKLKLTTTIISSSHQAKELGLDGRIKIHDKIDNKFKQTIEKNVNKKKYTIYKFGS